MSPVDIIKLYKSNVGCECESECRMNECARCAAERSVECRVSTEPTAVLCARSVSRARRGCNRAGPVRLATRSSLLSELRFEYFSASPPSHSLCHSHPHFHALLALHSFHWSQIADRTPLSFIPLHSPPPIYFLIVTLYFILGCLNFGSHSIFSLPS